jgi:uncharacterized protein (DUF58 family)
LLIEAERVAQTIMLGAHGRRRPGPGESFWQFRRYQPSDPAAMIDWRQSAKADPLYVRETEWMAAHSLWLWVDPSASMRWRSTPDIPEKRDRALLLALALASLLLKGGERVALLGTGDRPLTGRSALPRLAERLLAQPEESDLPMATPPRYGHVLVISDFLMPMEGVRAGLRRWSGAGITGHLVHIFDPAEESMPYSGRLRFEGLEGEGDILVSSVDTLKSDYQARFAEFRDQIRLAAGAVGWTTLSHSTGAPPAPALLALHSALAGTG